MARPIKTSKGYRLQFHFRNLQYKRGLIKNEHVAKILQNKISALLEEIKIGVVKIPSGIPVQDFIFNSVLQEPAKSEICTPNPQKILFLSEMIALYQRYCVPPIKLASTCQTEKYHLARLQDFIHDSHDPEVKSIKIGFFNDYKKFRYMAGVRTDTVKKELGTFQALFKFAVENAFVDYNVVRDVKRDKSQVPGGRFRTVSEINSILSRGKYNREEIKEIRRFCYLRPGEIKELLKIFEGTWLYPMLVTFAYTGVRRGELAKLRWMDIDFERNIMQISSEKQSQRSEIKRNIEIHPDLLCLLLSLSLRRGNNKFVFHDDGGEKIKLDTMSNFLRKKLKGTKFGGIGFHVFRHSLASNLAEKGIDQRIIDSILGHQTEEMRKRYQHLFPGKQSEALKKISMM